MDISISVVFILVAVVFLLLTLLIIIRMGFFRLEGAIGIAGDGFPPGTAAPHWSLTDLAGQTRKTPALNHWQFLIFVDYALGGFPDLVTGIQYFHSTVKDVEVIVLSRDNKDFCEAMVRGLDLKVPVVPVNQSFYNYFRVRVMPFAFLLDPQGIVRWAGVVNTKALLVHLWTLAQAVESRDLSFKEMKR